MAEKMDGKSMDIVESNLARLKEIYPEAFTEGKIDAEKLLVLLGESVDNSNEKYSFTWNGKNDCIRLAQTPSTGTLLPCKQKSLDWDTTQNIYIEGDNLEVLKLLQKSYLGKIKMIYIDPPYNTGNDFVYEDDFSDNIANYKKVTGQVTKSNAETQGRYHTNWLNMMYPRLKLARTLLEKDGVIFISIDDNEQSNLRKICDEIFGESNFVAELVWQRAFSPKNDARYISNSHDYILMYAKNIENFVIGRLPRTEDANARYDNPDNDPRGPWMSSDLSVKTYNASTDYPITTPSGVVVNPPSGRCWRTSKESFDKLVAEDRVYFGDDGSNTPRLKRFLSELKFEGMAPTSILLFKDVGHSQEGSQEVTKLLEAGVFDGPKPVRLLSRLLTLANLKSDSIVLDFFSGSATTAHALMQANADADTHKKFILVQLPEGTEPDGTAYKAGYKDICEIGEERIRKAGIKIKNEYGLSAMNLDTGFRVFKLDNSSLVKWDNSPTEDVNVIEDRIQQSMFYLNEGRTNMDFVYEIMLKFGMPLTAQVKEVRIGEVETYGVSDGAYSILVCLDEHVKIDDIEKMADTTYGTLIFADRCFDDANMLINAEEVLKKRNKQMRLF